MCFKIAITKLYFISASIKAAKGKTDINKSLTMHGVVPAIHYYQAFIIIKIQP